MSKRDAIPWLEKYRPQKLEEIVGNEEIIHSLGFFVEKGNPPHFILSVGLFTLMIGVQHRQGFLSIMVF